ncbi:MAG: hypothetical protein H6648_05430 [Caldilineae bacterium]|nr:hypothetical protein [Caldilineae bacterium]
MTLAGRLPIGLLLAGFVLAGGVLADENHWQLLRPGGRAPQALQWAAHTWDPGRNMLLVFGGTDQVDEKNELWRLDLAAETWDLLRPRGTQPGSRREAAMAFDPVGDRALVFGGYAFDTARSRPIYYDDSWLLELGGADGPEWVKLPFGAVKPAARRGASLVHQPGAAGGPGRMLLFGGWDHVSRLGFADVWAFDLQPGREAWTELGAACAPGPTARDGHSAIYEPRDQRMIVFGGWDRVRSSWRTLDDLWAFDLSGRGDCWRRIEPPSPVPPALAWHSAVYDACPASPRMLVFGGLTGSGSASGGYRVSDTSASWSLALALPGMEAWTQLDPNGARPRPRDAHAAALDPSGRRKVIFGGWENEGELLRDVWALELAPCAAPTAEATPSPSPTASSEPTPSSQPPATPSPSASPSPTASDTPAGPPSVTPDRVGTSVAATLTAAAPTRPASATPDAVGTSVAATLTAAAPTPRPSPTPDLVGTAVAATLTAVAQPAPALWLPWLGRAALGTAAQASTRKLRIMPPSSCSSRWQWCR